MLPLGCTCILHPQTLYSVVAGSPCYACVPQNLFRVWKCSYGVVNVLSKSRVSSSRSVPETLFATLFRMNPLFLPKPRNLQKPGWCILFRRPVLSTFPSGSIHRLGGWTQTSVTPSPLCRQEFEEQRRLLRNLCFRCGGSHFANTCSKSIRGVEYK